MGLTPCGWLLVFLTVHFLTNFSDRMKIMQVFVFMAVVLLAGAMLPVQAGLNHKMGNAIASPEYASFISFLIGTVGLLGYLLFIKQDLGVISQSINAPWYSWAAGLLGAFYVTTIIIMTPRLGVALTFALIVTGQMLLSVMLDHFGLLGMQVRAINWGKVMGIVCLIVGVIIIRKS